ncbi:proline--tRNA ligase [Candidatus Chromulinivorax destructor]|uniref:Proline--tRNA ligase n=2 Tax=Candidatus Chromulinivorax destructor TaxID=2066483 RepID=A0A345ZA84_9BACT|nr:proline--tRNA ligase [Candidatus Chromulinivorax destructor]
MLKLKKLKNFYHVWSIMSKLPDITKKFPDWYQEVIYEAELAEQAPVRGCVVIRPYGNAIWEEIKAVLDKKIKDTGHENAIFPLLIPLSFLEKEAEHVAGFAPELAIVTHAGGKKLEEPLVVRPTSETMIHAMFAKWIKSYRDLPLKINQWANVMRWEKRPRAFLRTSEFFWQEGHTAHETHEEALQETLLMLSEYVDLAQNYLAIPVIQGRKSPSEQFPGAEATYTFEGFMIDGKALQMGTSHLLSQNFAKSFDMKFQNKEGQIAYPYLTSWGATTRLVGAIIASHGDQKGLIIPPRIAPIQLVIIPIYRSDEEKLHVLAAAHEMTNILKKAGIRVKCDDNDNMKPGAKFFKWELRGIPFRLEIGPRDLAAGTAMIASRLSGEKQSIAMNDLITLLPGMLDQFHHELFATAQARYEKMWHKIEKIENFGKQLEEQAGIYQTGWCRDAACEQLLKPFTGSIRCLLSDRQEMKECFGCNKPSVVDVIAGKSY